MLPRASAVAQGLLNGCAPGPIELRDHSLGLFLPTFEGRSVPMKVESGIVAIDFAHEQFCIVPVRRQDFERKGSRLVSQATAFVRQQQG
jgi:hypothetical protein